MCAHICKCFCKRLFLFVVVEDYSGHIGEHGLEGKKSECWRQLTLPCAMECYRLQCAVE